MAQSLRGKPLLRVFQWGTTSATAAVYPLSQPDLRTAQFSTAEPQDGDSSGAIAGLYFSDGATPYRSSGSPTDAQPAFPLKHTDVQATIQGHVARVELTQTFENPFDEALEAIYVFPLPDEAAVDDMEILVGDRRIKGDIKQRQEAQEIYQQALEQGRTAGLLEQERANIFTQSLANIRPGEQIEVTIRYNESLQFEGNNYEFVFPMVVGPRYIPGTPTTEAGDTVQVPDASRITPPVLEPGTRSGHDIAVTLNIDAGVTIQTVDSPSHKVQLTPSASGDPSKLQLQLAPNDTIPNKDLIVRYQLAGDATQTAVLTDTTEQGGHFALYLIPAVDYATEEIVPKDVVFLMDTSGSQRGEPLAQSQELMRRMVAGLNPDDTFTIIDFANTTTRLSPNPLPNTASNRTLALTYIDQLTANGGTELLNGIREVLRFPAAERDRLRSIVLLTDGYIGNEAAVIAEMQQELAAGNRLYSFGVGSSVNRFLIDRLAEVGRGTAQVIRQDEPTEVAAERFFQQINNPVLTNIQVEWIGNGTAVELYPAAASDLFANQPLVIFGRKSDQVSGQLRVTGTMAGGDRYEQIISVNFDQREGAGAIAQLWGRSRIKDLMTQMYSGETVSGVEAVTQTALDYRLLSQYTAFVAVSEEVRVDPDGTRRTVEVPVELPEGVSYEGIFGGQDESTFTNTPAGVGYALSPNPRTRRSGNRVAPNGGFAPPPASAPSAAYGLGSNGEQRQAPLDPNLPSETIDEDLAPAPVLPTVAVSIVSLNASLDRDVRDELEEQLSQYLQRVHHSSDGDSAPASTVVWQVRVQNGRVIQVLWDDQKSSVTEQEIVGWMRRSLQAWSAETVAPTLTTTLEITVEL
ncbi:MAG: after-VIT domain-containing protein [Cyanothece sp. SIO2G6]|nr:after-VIT domain-containing protein [Cyanothece sp. SIO2G6]